MNNRSLICLAFTLVLVTSTFVGCSRAVTPPVATSVPLAAWIEKGVPDDTVIDCISHQMKSDLSSHVTIHADGSVSSRISDPLYKRNDGVGTGQISQDDLKRILLKFAEVDFFSLYGVQGCVYNVNHQPLKSTPHFCGQLDYTEMTISISIRRMSKSILYYSGWQEDENLYTALEELAGMCLALDRFAGEP